jgi:hypothetical protein
MGMGPISTQPKPVKRATEIKATMEPVTDSNGEFVGYKVSFTPASHGEEEHFIEKAMFASASASLSMTPSGEVTFTVTNPSAIAQGKHDLENYKRKREKRPSLEEEAAAREAAEKAEAEAKAKVAEKAAEPPTTIQ